MSTFLDIITITKDDPDGLFSTIESTKQLRNCNKARQIVIDSSNSQHSEKIKEYVSHEPNVKYHWQEPSGIASAFNLGLALSESEWVWFLNGKDLIHPALDIQNLFYLLEHSKADAIIFELEFMQSHTRYKHPPMHNLWPPVANWIPHPATILRRELFEQFGCFDESYSIAMDGDLWFRFFSQDTVVDMLSIPIVLYDEDGVSSLKPKETAVEVFKILKLNLWKLIKIWLGNGTSILYAMWHYYKVKHGR